MARTKTPTITGKLQEIRQGFESAKAGVQELQRIDAEYRDSHATAITTLRSIVEDLQPVDVIVREMRETVDAREAQWRERHGLAVARAFSGACRLTGHDGEKLERVSPAMFDLSFDNRLGLDDLCGIAPDLVKAQFERVIRGHVTGAPGLPLEDRPAAVEQQRAVIAEIELQHSELVDHCARLDPPIVLELLPAVRQRRERQAMIDDQRQIEAEARERSEAQLKQRFPRRGTSAFRDGAGA